MIIIFFHVLYLIGKLVYKTYRQPNDEKQKEANDEVEELQGNRTIDVSNKYRLIDPDEVYNDLEDDNSDEPLVTHFSPPSYIQRYLAVTELLQDARYRGKIRKVVDFGCSELGFLTYLKHTEGIQEILCVDVDRDTLENNKDKAIPLNVDYLCNRSMPLTIDIYEGSVTHKDKKLANSNAVIAIELIEHLYPDTLMDFPVNVFGYIKPLLAVVTTPNADFNVLFRRLKGFRHWDHKFEWTRLEFEDWARNIVMRYPEYKVSFKGIAPGPPGTEEFGCCTQMAIFERICEISGGTSNNGVDGLLKLVSSQEYPFRIDNRSDEEKILDDINYHIRRSSQQNWECLEDLPLVDLLKFLGKNHMSVETLRDILETGGWNVVDRENGPAVLYPELSTFSDYENEVERNDNDFDGDLDIDVDDTEDRPYDYWGDGELDPSWLYEREVDPRSELESNVEMLHAERWDDDFEIPGPTQPNESEENWDAIDTNDAVESTGSPNSRDFSTLCSTPFEPENSSRRVSGDPMTQEKRRAPETLELDVIRERRSTAIACGTCATNVVGVSESQTNTHWRNVANSSELIDAKTGSPEGPVTPPNSSSPEIMDSGYPNSSSTQDTTPEYELSSIDQDGISESESPSLAEAPRLGYLDNGQVENGDLANNNRDREGNNMMAADAAPENDLEEDLQPLIDVLENDLENENDIYALENGFPIWLLRILVRRNVPQRDALAEQLRPPEVPQNLAEDRDQLRGDYADIEVDAPDEGFDGISSSGSNDHTDPGDYDNIEEDISAESSDGTLDWRTRGDSVRTSRRRRHRR